ncbi:MAG: tripartite tricarboxylate transporter substrate binding protein [Alcaligenaceae bacterium]
MTHPVKRLCSIAVSLLALSGGSAAVAQTPAPSVDAQAWPTKSITLVVTYAAGGFADTRMRQLARKLTDKLGQPVVVENKVGAGGVVGTAVIAKAAPDGYTIGSGNLAPLAVNPTLMTMLPYNPQKDLAPVILIENSPLVLSVSNTLPIKSLADLIALAKKEPGKLTFGSSGIGGAHHLSGEMFRDIANIDIVHVPYKGGAPASTDLMAGHLSMMFEMGYAALPAIKGQKIRPLAVTSSKRLTLLPDVPTMAELGISGFESYNWQGIIAPAGTPVAIIGKLNAALNEILLDPEVIKQIADTGSQAGGGTPEDFARFIASETTKWAKVIKSAKIQPE